MTKKTVKKKYTSKQPEKSGMLCRTFETQVKSPMKHLPAILSLLALFSLSSCGQKEEESEIDYDNMVMADEEEEWTTVGEDQKVIANDALPDPQELIILEAPEKKQ